MFNQMKKLFSQHLARLQQIVRESLEKADFDGVWIYSGEAKRYFLDDLTAPFKINPHFNWFFPYPSASQSWLYLDGMQRPKIYFFAPQDYWHSVQQAPLDDFFADEFDWVILEEPQQIQPYLTALPHKAFIGENEKTAVDLGFNHINPQKLLNYWHFERAQKSEFEIQAVRLAQQIAVRGHFAAKTAFFEGKSERDIHFAYLQASAQTENDLPYGNIVALNRHGAILHYMQQDVTSPPTRHSFLLDAGATCFGYCADITRTYAADPQSEFAELVTQMEQLKLQCIANLRTGVNYLAYHTQMQQQIAGLLQRFDFVRLAPEVIFEEGISRAFFPHGLGHLLGLQTHDVGGWQQNHRGARKAPPAVYPSLRCTRDLQANMLLTIEPGLYFIEMLLKPWQNAPLARYFNWQKISQFSEYGGIRTEDNVLIRENAIENLTAEAFAK